MGAAVLLNNSSELFIIAFCVDLLVTAFLVWAVSKGVMRWTNPFRIALSVSAAATILLVVGAALTVLRPLPSTPVARRSPPVPAGVRYWNLSTGSHIAYLEIHAQGKAKPNPIILVGGGPGEEDVASTAQTQFFGQFAKLGYDVYFYDQIGSGLSARLNNPKQYTVARQVEDLEAIRKQIGASKVILMGESWGGTLVAHYMAAYPQHVAKAVFTSPAPINYFEWPSADDSIISRLNKTAQQQANSMLYGNPRFILWYLIGEVNPKAALSLVSNREADDFFNTFLQFVYPGIVCNPAHLPHQPQQGNGFYDNIFTTRNADTFHPAVNPRTVLASDHTPVLIMTASCNYIMWAIEWQYRMTFPDSRLLYFANAGHEIYLDQPTLYQASIRAFLLGTSLPIKPWTSAQPPASLGK